MNILSLDPFLLVLNLACQCTRILCFWHDIEVRKQSAHMNLVLDPIIFQLSCVLMAMVMDWQTI